MLRSEAGRPGRKLSGWIGERFETNSPKASVLYAEEDSVDCCPTTQFSGKSAERLGKNSCGALVSDI